MVVSQDPSSGRVMVLASDRGMTVPAIRVGGVWSVGTFSADDLKDNFEPVIDTNEAEMWFREAADALSPAQPTGDLGEAIAMAARAHEGQVSKDGEPYVFHPIRVMLAGKTDAERIVGVLHDVVEDTDVALDDLRSKGFSDEILAGVDAMTKREGEEYQDFIARCKANPIARRVKLADIADNLNLDRLPELNAKDFERIQKYRRARKFLMAD